MPQIKNNQVDSNLLNPALNFRDRLVERFQPHEYVRVINCDNEPIRWSYLPSHLETFTFTPDPMKITHRGEVETYLLNPGESEVLLGECAYIMIEALYKQIVAHKKIQSTPDQEPHTARNFNFSDPIQQEEWINKIYLGKETPNFSFDSDTKSEAKVEKQPKSPVERQLKQHLNEQTN